MLDRTLQERSQSQSWAASACLRGASGTMAMLLPGEKFLIVSFSREPAAGGKVGSRCLIST